MRPGTLSIPKELWYFRWRLGETLKKKESRRLLVQALKYQASQWPGNEAKLKFVQSSYRSTESTLTRKETGESRENPQERLRSSDTQPTYNDCRGGKRGWWPQHQPASSRNTARDFLRWSTIQLRNPVEKGSTSLNTRERVSPVSTSRIPYLTTDVMYLAKKTPLVCLLNKINR